MANQRDSSLTAEQIFGRQMRFARETKGWSQSVVAEQLASRGINLHFSAIAKIENGNRTIRLNEAVAISDIFKIPIAEMLAWGNEISDLRAAIVSYENEVDAAKRQLQALTDILGKLRRELGRLEEARDSGQDLEDYYRPREGPEAQSDA